MNFTIISLNQLGRRNVLNLLLDGAAQIARAVLDRIGLLRDIVDQRVVPSKRHTARRQRITQLVEENHRDIAEILLTQMVKRHDLINAVNEFRTHDLGKRLERLFRAHLLETVRPKPSAVSVRSEPAFEVMMMMVFSKLTVRALCVRDAAVVQDLQQDVQDIRVRLFDLIEEDHAVGAADTLRKLPPASS